MSTPIEIRLPDIGDFAGVPIIEVHVAPGDQVAADDPIVTLESDKATMDVPAPQAGTVRELRVGVGDEVSEGDLLLLLDAAGAAGAPAGGLPAKERVHESAHPTAPGPAGYGSPAGVYERLEVRVPDIGDYRDVPVIEVHVAAGDTIAAEDPLITLESDKATMDVPAPAGGTVTGLRVAVGDTVSEGDVIVQLQTGEEEAAPPAPRSRPPPRRSRRRRPRRRRPRRRASRPTSRPRCWCSGPGRAATAPPSGPPTWARPWCWWTAPRSWAGSA